MSKLSEVLDEAENAKTSIELLEKFVKYARRLLTKKRQKELIDLMFREILKGEAGDMDVATSAMNELQKLGASSGDFEKAKRYLSLATKVPAKKGRTCKESGREEGSTCEEGCTGQEGNARDEGRTGQEGCACEEGGDGEEADCKEARSQESSKEGGAPSARCACGTCCSEDHAESGGSMAVPNREQAVTVGGDW